MFQVLLLSLQCGYLAVSMLQGDSESYVRASAIRLLTTMVPIDKIWTESLAALQVRIRFFFFILYKFPSCTLAPTLVMLGPYKPCFLSLAVTFRG